MPEVPNTRRVFEHEGKHYEVWSMADPDGTAFAIYEDGRQITVRRVADWNVCNKAGPNSIRAMMDLMSALFRQRVLERLPPKPRDNS